jgi:spore germination protein YaaH
LSPDRSQDDDEDASAIGGWRGWLRIGVGLALVAAVLGVGLVLTRSDERPPPRPDIPLDAWAPYWALDSSVPDLRSRLPLLRDVSPFWFDAVGETEIVVATHAPEGPTEEFIEAVRASEAKLVPSIVDATASGEMAAILADPDRRANHVRALLDFADDGGYDGLDIDYEQFAFADGRSTWAATRPNWVAFIEELAAGLHSAGRTLTVSIPPVYDAERTGASGFWVYDYGAIAPNVDRIRIMAYDFSVGSAGPIAPLDFVESAIEGAIAATEAPEKLVLGLPAYGRNWVTRVSGECPESAPGRTAVTARSVDELIATRAAVPVFVEETGEWTFDYELELSEGDLACVQTRRVHYVDADGVRLRMDLAREYHLDGVSLWALGFDDPTVWSAILPTIADPTPTTTIPD